MLRLPEGKTDFCSNDYLGIAKHHIIEQYIRHSTPMQPDPTTAGPGSPLRHGSSGSRLLAGNYPLIESVEESVAAFHHADAGLIFNSGYDANLGLISCVPQRGDTILYDTLSHASLRDGIRLSFAHSHAFLHNDLEDLERRLKTAAGSGTLFVVTESVFSMDGDLAPLAEMAPLCEKYGAHLIVDEAHATGVVGKYGEGLVQHLHLQTACFARIHTFGKAVGCHGAIILGSSRLRDYLINFCRAFIYTTALPETSVAAIQASYARFPAMEEERTHLRHLISRFRQTDIPWQRLESSTPIQVVIVPGNREVKKLAADLQDNGLDVRPILYPTVPKEAERLRIVLHAFNTTEEVDRLTGILRR